MELPYANVASIAEEKITGYLLNPKHPEGFGKAKFFTSLGFNCDQWEDMAKSLRDLATNCPVTANVVSPHGSKYIIDGLIHSPSGAHRLLFGLYGLRTMASPFPV